MTSSVVVTLRDVMFECPVCRQSMVIDESATGKIIKCEQCSTNVIVPPKLPVPPPVELPVIVNEPPSPPPPVAEVKAASSEPPATAVAAAFDVALRELAEDVRAIVTEVKTTKPIAPPADTARQELIARSLPPVLDKPDAPALDEARAKAAEASRTKPVIAPVEIVTPKPPAPTEAERRAKASESLLLAAKKGDAVLLNEALAQGADINATNLDGTTALMIAVEQEHDDLVQTLIARGADIEAKRRDGQTAVTLAGRAGRFHIVRKLWKADTRQQRPWRFFGSRRRGR